MTGRLLLIASDDDYQELAAYGGLPGSLLKAATRENLIEQLEAEPPWIVQCPREAFTASGDGAAAQRDAARVFNNLIDRAVCYLAVVGGEDLPSDPESASAAEANTKSSLADHAAWYRRFRQEMHRLDPVRAMHVRHVLVLVSVGPLGATALQALEQLVTGAADDKLFDLAYVMLDELEPGAAAGNLFYAVDAWPAAVGNLLLKLLHDRLRPSTGKTLTMAWRSFRLVPELVADEPGSLERDLYGQVVAQLIGDVTPDRGWEPHRLSKIGSPSRADSRDALRRPDDDGDLTRLPWHEYPVDRRTDEIISDERWEQRLVDAGRQLAGDLSGVALEQDPPAGQEIGKVWRSVHQHPRYVYAAAANRELLRGPELGDQFAEIARRWSTALRRNADRHDLIDNACQCADDLQQSQMGYLPLWPKVAIASGVSLVLLLLAITCTGGLLMNWSVATTAIVASIAGAMGAAFASHYLEQRAGERARRDLEDQFREVDHQIIQRHEACRAAVLSAHEFWQHAQVRAAAERLKSTIGRVKAILDAELRESAARRKIASAADKEAGGEKDNVRHTPDEVHRLRYLDRMRLSRSIDAEVLADNDDQLTQLVQHETQRFLQQLWLPFCERHDTLRTGHLPARALIPALRRFHASFHEAATAATAIIAMRRLTDEDMAAWGRQLHQLLVYQEYFELASCRLLSRQTAPEKDRPLPTLILRRGFDYGPLMVHLEASAVQRLDEDSTYLQQLPLIGLLHQELPVKFHAKNDRIRVATFD